MSNNRIAPINVNTAINAIPNSTLLAMINVAASVTREVYSTNILISIITVNIVVIVFFMLILLQI